MRVGKIGHASITVETADVCCFMDPILTDPFDSDTNTFDPPIAIDTSNVADMCNLVVISHAHMDHFSPRSLALFDRTIPVMYPAGAGLIEHALRRLGFEDLHPLSPNTKVEVEGLTLYPTASRVPFPELGMIFAADGQVFWNVVDTVLDDGVIGRARREVGRPDLLFAKYQPLVENPIRMNALGSDFPVQRYGDLLKNVWTIHPRYVAPGSCGYRYTRGEWLNDRGFPVTEEQFAADVRQVAPDIQVVHVPHGGTIDLGPEMAIDLDGMSFVRRLGDRITSSFDWRPERGVPPLRDANPRGLSIERLREETHRIVEDVLLAKISSGDALWREKMAGLGAVWRLELVFPDDSREVRLLDFAQPRLGWRGETAHDFVKLHTSITASSLVDVLNGYRNMYSLTFNEMRVVHRMYRVHRDGLATVGGLDDEPLSRFLFGQADYLYIEGELKRILGESS